MTTWRERTAADARSLVFLDIDGVLNCHEKGPGETFMGIQPSKAVLFNRLLEDSGSAFVVSSAWRYLVHRGDMTLDGLDWMFRSHWIHGNRLIGITREDTMISGPHGPPVAVANERGQQITDWLTANNWTRPYIVLDDLDLGISRARHPFIHLMGGVGLMGWDVMHAIERLGQTRKPRRRRTAKS